MQKASRAALAGAFVLLALVTGVIILAESLHARQGDITVPTPAPTGIPPGLSPTITGEIPHPGSFTFSIAPQTGQARPGETLTYTMDIIPVDGFNDTVHVTLEVSALFVTRNYDLGFYEPPFPRRIEYPLTVPTSIPSGITLEGKVTAQGAGIRKVETIHLRVV